jgi:hypothetical protein
MAYFSTIILVLGLAACCRKQVFPGKVNACGELLRTILIELPLDEACQLQEQVHEDTII